MEADTDSRQTGPPEELGSPGEFIRGFPRRLWSLALSPGQFFREIPGPGGYLNAVVFVTLSALAIPLVLAVIAAMIGIPVALIWAVSSDGGSLAGVGAGIGIGLLIALVTLVFLPIFIAVGLFVYAAVQHLFVLLFAGSERRGFGETFKLLAYALSPGYVASWIPVIGFFSWIWQVVLAVIGIREVHRTSTGRAVLAVAVPVVIVAMLSVAVAVSAAVLDSRFADSTSGGGPGGGGIGAPAPSPQSPQESDQPEPDPAEGPAQSASTPSGSASEYARELPDPSINSSPGITAQNVGFARDDLGLLTFYGEVLNEGEQVAVAVDVTVKLYNGNNEIVGELTSVGPMPTVIGPDQRGLWDAIFTGEDPPEDWSRTEIEVVADESLADIYARTYYPEVEASQARLNPAEPYSSPTVTAEVTNTGEQTPDVVQASAALYDEEDELVDVATMSASGSSGTVEPGESESFEGYVDNPGVESDEEYDVAVYLDGTRSP